MSERLLLRVTLIAWLGSLFALFGVQRLLLDPLPMPTNLILFAAQVAPVVAVVVALMRSSPRATFWASMISMLYFTHGVVQTATPDTRMIGLAEVFVSLSVFVSALLDMRRERHSGSE